MKVLNRYSLFLNNKGILLLDVMRFNHVTEMKDYYEAKIIEKDTETFKVKKSWIDTVNNHSLETAHPHLIFFTFSEDKLKNSLIIIDYASIFLQSLVNKAIVYGDGLIELRKQFDHEEET
jgi:hypothetical protein